MSSSVMFIPKGGTVTAIMATEQSPFMTTAEAATYLRLHQESVRRAVRQGRLKSLKTGKDLRFRKEDLDEYLERDRP